MEKYRSEIITFEIWVCTESKPQSENVLTFSSKEDAISFAKGLSKILGYKEILVRKVVKEVITETISDTTIWGMWFNGLIQIGRF